MTAITTVTFLFLSFCLSLAKAQSSIKQYVKENTVQISNISPYNEDYTELEAIGNAIGDARIVMLGEQDHGDAPAFLAKSKIIKYLHEEKGFNILAFESDFFALNAGWDGLPKTDSAMHTFIRNNIFWLWTDCDACQYLLYEYIPANINSTNPLRLTGFDNQIFLDFSYKLLRSTVDSICRYYELPITQTAAYTSDILPLIDSITNWTQPFTDNSQTARCHEYFSQIKFELGSKLPADDFWMQVIDNLIAANSEFGLFGKNDPLGNEVRDAQMAENIAWLSRVKYPNEKMIVWGHNMHVAKQTGNNHVNNFGNVSMGGFMSRDTALIAQTYVMGFTSYNGSTARIKGRMRSITSKKRSFESWVNNSYFYGFTNFDAYIGNQSQKFQMKGNTHQHSKEAWLQKYDGIFYIRTMYPCIAK